jgi:hypothetical protein
MTGIAMTKRTASAALRLGVLAGLVAVAGCSEPAPTDKRDDPALKSSTEKSLAIYKSKSASTKINPSRGKPTN